MKIEREAVGDIDDRPLLRIFRFGVGTLSY